MDAAESPEKAGFPVAPSAIEDDDPVIFFEPKRIYNGPFNGHHDQTLVPWSKHPLSEVPEEHYRVPLESAKVHRPGADLTVIAYGTMVWVSEAAAGELMANDPAVRQFALEQVELVSDATCSGVQAVVHAQMKSGVTHSARCDEPKGTPDNRMTRGEIEAKFRQGARGRLSARQVDEVIGAIARLEELHSARGLMEALRVDT